MRNAESHFSVNPTDLDIGRSRFDRPFNHKSTCNVGDLVPFYWTEILPGDTVSMKTSKVIRMSTLLDPVMDNLFWDTYYFFVPMRLVWEHTKEFFGENTQTAWAPSATYGIPQIIVSSAGSTPVGVQPQTIMDYMGIPVGVDNLAVSALPVRSYNRVWNDWFMDQMTMAPPNMYYGDAAVTYSPTNPVLGGKVYQACKLHDYFSSCTPSPQRGNAVSLPISGSVAVTLSGLAANVTAAGTMHGTSNAIRFARSTSDTSYSYLRRGSGAINNDVDAFFGESSGSSGYANTATNLVVNWPSSASGNFSANTGITVNDLRLAFQMQKWLEKSALYGGRYVEMLKAQFGVTSPDARLQRTEYLGGNRIPINVHQVENTASGSTPLGHLGAYSATSDYNEDFTHSFTEHGILIGVACARYKHSYPQGIERAWSRKTMWDFYFPVLANIGNQAVLKKEIFAQGTAADDTVWAYQEAWADYRYHPDRVSGFMRPGVSGSLASWHYADHYASEPTFSSSWMVEDKTNVDRTLAVTSSAAPQILFDIECDATFVRPMPLYSVPGLIDHH